MERVEHHLCRVLADRLGCHNAHHLARDCHRRPEVAGNLGAHEIEHGFREVVVKEDRLGRQVHAQEDVEEPCALVALHCVVLVALRCAPDLKAEAEFVDLVEDVVGREVRWRTNVAEISRAARRILQDPSEGNWIRNRTLLFTTKRNVNQVVPIVHDLVEVLP